MATWEDVIWTILYVFLIFLLVVLLENLARSAIHKRTRITPDQFREDIDGLIFAGHSTVLFRLAGTVVLTDPSLTPNYFCFHTLGIHKEDLPKVDLVVISHSHADHNHPASLRVLARFNKHLTLLVPQGYATRYKYNRRYRFAQVIEVGKYQSVQVKNLTVTNVPADHYYSPHASGWIFERNPLVSPLVDSMNTIYFAGDTGYNHGMFQEIGDRFSIDLAFLPMGCFEGRMLFSLLRPSFARVHMSPRDLPRAILDLRCRAVVPIHWGTYIIGCEPPKVAPALLQQLQESNIVPTTVQLMLPGRWHTLGEINNSPQRGKRT
jgi:L-ascorbate metabolism protein UlaG (beta-lactamase superfamily)